MQYGYFHIPQRMIEFIAPSQTTGKLIIALFNCLRYVGIEGQSGRFPLAAEVHPWVNQDRNPVIFGAILRSNAGMTKMSDLWYNTNLVGMCLLGSCQPAVGIDPDTKREIYLHDIDYWMEMGLRFDIPSFAINLVEMYIDYLNVYIYDKRDNNYRKMSQCVTMNFNRCLAKCVRYMNSNSFYDLIDEIRWRGPRVPSRIFNIKVESYRDLIEVLPKLLPGPLILSKSDFCCELCKIRSTNLNLWWPEEDEETIVPIEIVKSVEGYEVCLKCIVSSMIVREWFAPSLFDILYENLKKEQL